MKGKVCGRKWLWRNLKDSIRYLSEGMEENHEHSQPLALSRNIFEIGISEIQVRSVTT